MSPARSPLVVAALAAALLAAAAGCAADETPRDAYECLRPELGAQVEGAFAAAAAAAGLADHYRLADGFVGPDSLLLFIGTPSGERLVQGVHPTRLGRGEGFAFLPVPRSGGPTAPDPALERLLAALGARLGPGAWTICARRAPGAPGPQGAAPVALPFPVAAVAYGLNVLGLLGLLALALSARRLRERRSRP